MTLAPAQYGNRTLLGMGSRRTCFTLETSEVLLYLAIHGYIFFFFLFFCFFLFSFFFFSELELRVRLQHTIFISLMERPK